MALLMDELLFLLLYSSDSGEGRRREVGGRGEDVCQQNSKQTTTYVNQAENGAQFFLLIPHKLVRAVQVPVR